MAQSPITQQLPGTLGRGLEQGLAGVRTWPGAVLGGLRRSVLPDYNDPIADSTTPRSALSGVQRLLVLLPTMLMGLASILLVAAVALFIFRDAYQDRIYPAIVVGDVNVGGLTSAQAESRVSERAAELEQGTIAFSYHGQTWTPTLAELGATVDIDASVAEARDLGRGGDAATRLSFANDLLHGDQMVPLRTTVDMAVLNSWFDSVDRDINDPAISAQLVIDGDSISVTDEEPGTIVDREAATQQILGSLASLQPVAVSLPTQVDVPAILASDLEQVRGSVGAAVSQPIRVTFEGKTWRIDGAVLTSYLSIDTVLENGKPAAELAMDTERLARDLRTQFVPEVNREPENARVAWSDENGLIALDPSTTGVTLKADAFAEAVASSYLGGHEPVEVPVLVTRPTIDDENLDALGITEQLGSGDSNYAGGALGRDTNIEVGVSFLNGTLVPPGGIFSFNKAVGEITYEKGYAEAEVVVAEEIGRDVGGGICQVSTTVFRAALLAGMPIEEWHQHSYRLGNYERDGWGPGFDASILQNSWQSPEAWPDFKFQNYTDSWLLVESWTSYPHVIVSIYGTSDGRTVDLNAWGMDGKTAGFTRTIYDAAGNEIAERSFWSTFR